MLLPKTYLFNSFKANTLVLSKRRTLPTIIFPVIILPCPDFFSVRIMQTSLFFSTPELSGPCETISKVKSTYYYHFQYYVFFTTASHTLRTISFSLYLFICWSTALDTILLFFTLQACQTHFQRGESEVRRAL